MELCKAFSALSDPVRQEILILLRTCSLSAGEIGAHFDITAAVISYHLKKLKKANLICECKFKNYIYYSINPPVLDEILSWMLRFREGGNNEWVTALDNDYRKNNLVKNSCEKSDTYPSNR